MQLGWKVCMQVCNSGGGCWVDRGNMRLKKSLGDDYKTILGIPFWKILVGADYASMINGLRGSYKRLHLIRGFQYINFIILSLILRSLHIWILAYNITDTSEIFSISVTKFYGRLRLIRSVWEHQNFPC